MPTWFARRVLDLVDKLTDVYYRRKYGAIARHLGRPGITATDRRGFIIIQIDGLSHDHLMQALAGGYMPYLGRLLAEQRLAVAPWRCGLPSSTPAVQAGMMYGNRFDIPGFRWYEKDRGTVMMPYRIERIRTVRERASDGNPGILRGGSCYVSMLDGDADLALFTLSSFQRQRFLESARGVGLLLLFLLSPLRVLRVLWRAAWGYSSALGRRLIALIKPSILNPLDIVSPLLHAFSDAFFTEVQTFGVMLDIYRCVPAIYTNYNGYDEAAHKLGPNHPAAFRVLTGVDNRIRQIERMRSLYRQREYDLYLMSDHGNTPAVPFQGESARSLGQYIIAQLGEGLLVDEGAAGHAHRVKRARYLLEELHAMGGSLSPRLRPVLAAVRRYVDQRVWARREREYDLDRQRDVVVSASGPLAHIYFNVSSRPLDLIEVMLLYPDLLDHLPATEGIGAVAGRAGERTVVLGRRGGMLVSGEKHEVIESPHPLEPLGEASYAADQVHRLAHFPHAGDLIVLGAIGPGKRVVTFEQQAATHGGLGGPQGRPFIAWPPGRPLTPETLNDAEDLYPYFMQHYQEQPAVSNPDNSAAKERAPA